MADKEIPIFTKLLIIVIILYVETNFNKIMSGKDYYGIVMCHTLLMSAMIELYWDAFKAWTFEQPDVNLDDMASISGSFQDLADAKNVMCKPTGRRKHVNQIYIWCNRRE